MDAPFVQLLDKAMGIDEAIVLIRGYLSDRKARPDSQEEWVQSIREAGWQGAIYHLWWDASNMDGLAGHVGGGAAVATGAAVGYIAGPIGIAAGALLGGLLGGRKHWSKIKKRAKHTGRDYAVELLREISETSISLLGHSLGARVIYYLLRELPGSGVSVKDAFLVGGAVRRDSSKKWGEVADNIQGLLVNVHNKSDSLLSGQFRAAEHKQNPCGRKPIKKKHPQIINVDARYIINSSSHFDYHRYLGETIGRYFHR